MDEVYANFLLGCCKSPPASQCNLLLDFWILIFIQADLNLWLSKTETEDDDAIIDVDEG
ncbi:hypothetical protein PIB30_098461 [Stylosanthes scabra]|uniref:Uncharacterized protein n=1 Tax=Stylosanthes scabra TaxID=79078 RepID=A0ABU6ZV85_9FABA|nr:hypothetical protein [Stylosanthes scabra]